jgi:hypothetical protein
VEQGEIVWEELLHGVQEFLFLMQVNQEVFTWTEAINIQWGFLHYGLSDDDIPIFLSPNPWPHPLAGLCPGVLGIGCLASWGAGGQVARGEGALVSQSEGVGYG